MSHTPTTSASPATPAARPPFALQFKARDLVNIGVFAVIYLAINFGVAMLGIISPLTMVLTLPLAPLASGIPFMLFLSRVRHAGMVGLFGIVVGLLSLAMGHPWQAMVVMMICGVLADLVMYAGRYRSTWAAIWATTIFAAWMIGPWIPFLIDPAGYIQAQAIGSMGSDYAVRMAQLLSRPLVLGIWLAGIVFGFLGGLLGAAVLRKHFVRAGLA